MSEDPVLVDPNLPADLPPAFALQDAIAVARDLATNMSSLDTVLKRHNLTEEQFKTLQNNAWFNKVYTKLAEEWGKIEKTQDRIKFQSLIGVEITLPSLIAGIANEKEALTSRVEAAKFAAKLGGVDAVDRNTPQSEKFVININVGGSNPVRIEKDVTPPKPLLETASLHADIKGEENQ